MTDNSIRAIHHMEDGTVWIGTTHSGIYKFDGTNWINYTPVNSGLPDYFIRTITQDSIGDIWIGTVEGLARFDGTNWQVWTIANAGLNSNNITSIAVGFDNKKYIGTINGGLIYYDNGSITEYTILEGGIPDNSSIGIVFDDQDNPWFASPSNGLFHDNGSQNWTSYTMQNSPIMSNGLTSIVVNNQNEFLLGTQESGIILFTPPNQWNNINSTNSLLSDNHILSLIIDSEESVWIGTNSQGLVKMIKNTYSLNEIQENSISIYPNPFNSVIHINSKTEIIDFCITDLTGKTINNIRQTSDNNQLAIEIITDNLSEGVYILSIRTKLGFEKFKLVKD